VPPAPIGKAQRRKAQRRQKFSIGLAHGFIWQPGALLDIVGG